MALQMFSDDAMTTAIAQTEKLATLGTTQALQKLLGIQVKDVYRYNMTEYVKLSKPSQYSVVGNSIILVTGLSSGEHIVVIPTDNVNLVFTGPEASTRVQTKKMIFHNNGTTTFDALKLYSEDLMYDPIEFNEVLTGTGFYVVGVDSSFSIYDGQGVLIQDAYGIIGFATTLDVGLYVNCAVCINDQYIGDCIGNDANTIVVSKSTIIPLATYIVDRIEMFSTGNLTFALDSNGTIPADTAFKRMLNIPTLTPTAQTQKVWMRDTAVIPALTSEQPNMPFKLAGQEYP